jgi:hypothetical protein
MNTLMDEEIRAPLRGVIRCKECLWYIGNNILRDRERICPICESKLEEA